MKRASPEFYGEFGQTVKRLYLDDGLSTHAIAKRFRCAQGRICRILRTLNIERRSCNAYNKQGWANVDKPIRPLLGVAQLAAIYRGRRYDEVRA